jgi:hypothetical protein
MNGELELAEELEKEFLNRAKEQEDSLRTRKAKIEIKEFTAPGEHLYDFNDGFPATIEVYAFGAGGGGQGGHKADALIGWKGQGTGGAGGGGAAAYMKLGVSGLVSFNIEVGKGGDGGSNIYVPVGRNWRSGYKGGNGGSTVVTWDEDSLIVAGGKGGGEGRANDWGTDNTGRTTTGGNGGLESNKSSTISLDNWASIKGDKGKDGSQTVQVSPSTGGSTGKLTVGSINPFGGETSGGAGGYNTNSGSKGSDGKVVIVITYFEE